MNHYFTNQELKSNLQKIQIKILDKTFTFNTDNGVFSKRGLDYGSRILLLTIIKENISGDVLDVGCGYGALGIILSFFKNITLDMVDVNKRAIHLTNMNLKDNKVEANAFYSECYSEVSKKYDYIITNPPIRAGKKIVYEILFKAKEHLKDEGKLYFVMKKEQGALTAIRDLKEVADVQVLEKEKGFFVISCKFN